MKDTVTKSWFAVLNNPAEHGYEGSRLKTLELKYGTNVTGSSFEVTFVTLTDVVVTGVWNEELGRIEF